MPFLLPSIAKDEILACKVLLWLGDESVNGKLI